MIKKILQITTFILASLLYSQNITVESGWQIKGTETGFIHMDSFNKECINTVWTFNQSTGWKAYAKDINTMAAIENSDTIKELQSIEKNEGFWINAYSDCNITTEANATQLPTELQNAIDGNLSTLSIAVKESLAYMGNEERLAYDIYNALFILYPSLKQFTNIATNSEYKHISTVQQLIQKYNIQDTDLSNVEEPLNYGETAIESMEAGKYDITTIQDLYDALYTKGSNSSIDALEVGCMVEVTDIDDLDKYIIQAQESNASDVVEAYTFLRDGSYNHYWSFDKGLINQGVSNGCCSIGIVDEINYCHPEYPKNTNGQNN